MEDFFEKLDKEVKIKFFGHIAYTEVKNCEEVNAYKYYVLFKHNFTYSRVFTDKEHEQCVCSGSRVIDVILDDIEYKLNNY